MNKIEIETTDGDKIQGYANIGIRDSMIMLFVSESETIPSKYIPLHRIKLVSVIE